MSRRFSRRAFARLAGHAGLSDLARLAALARPCAAAALAAALLAPGCASRPPIEVGPKDSAVRMTARGVLVDGRPVAAKDVPGVLKGSDVPLERTIHVRVDKDVRDLRQARMLMNFLARAGYRSSVLVTERHAEAFVPKGQERQGTQRARRTRGAAR